MFLGVFHKYDELYLIFGNKERLKIEADEVCHKMMNNSETRKFRFVEWF